MKQVYRDNRMAKKSEHHYGSVAERVMKKHGWKQGTELSKSDASTYKFDSALAYVLRTTADPVMYQSVTETCSSRVLECGHQFC